MMKFERSVLMFKVAISALSLSKARAQTPFYWDNELRPMTANVEGSSAAIGYYQVYTNGRIVYPCLVSTSTRSSVNTCSDLGGQNGQPLG